MVSDATVAELDEVFAGRTPTVDDWPKLKFTEMVALESMLDRLQRSGKKIILAGMRPEPYALLHRAGIHRVAGKLAFAPDVDTALSMAIVHTARTAA